MVVAAVDDLLFASRIRTAARQLDVRAGVRALARGHQPTPCATHSPRLLIVDLNGDRMAPIDTIRALRADATMAARCPIVAYVAHVDTALIAAAQAAGADHVMPRSQFVAQLARMLEEAR